MPLSSQCTNNATANFLSFYTIDDGVDHGWEEEVGIGHDSLEEWR